MNKRKKQKRLDAQLAYSKIHVPKMRSVFWKYFGFPADESGDIITKAKVICTICKSVLTNHYNTTNIRAHIQSNHRLVFAQLVDTHNISIPPRKIYKKENPDTSDISYGENQKAFKQCLKQSSIEYSDSMIIEENSMHMIDSIPLTYEDTNDNVSKEILKDTGRSKSIFEQTNNPTTSSLDENCKQQPLPLNITVDINPIQVDYDIEVALTKMIVRDLLNVSSIYSTGMHQFITSFLSNQILPSQAKLELSIKNRHSEEFEKLKTRIQAHSQSKPYSLGFDVWRNIEAKEFVSIYFKNISDEFVTQVQECLFVTIEMNNFTSFETVFSEFNLENCSAAIVNSNHEILNTFLSTNDVPIVPCFGYVINTCLKELFNLPEISDVLEEVKDVMAHFASEICSDDVDVPVVYEDFSQTKLAVLRFFCESVSWPEEQDILLNKAKTILDALNPLEVTLDTLREEEIPLSSLFLPFANKLIQKHYTNKKKDDSLVKDIKMIIVGELKKSICSNKTLTVTAMLDPRFHTYLSIENGSICNILERKYRQISKHRNSLQKYEVIGIKQEKSSRKSHLKMFFVDSMDDDPAESSQSGNIIENDLKRYQEEAFSSLEESPLLWWNNRGNTYGSLKSLAEAYNCILGFVNIGLKNTCNYQIRKYQKRFMLSGKLIDQITFLNNIEMT